MPTWPGSWDGNLYGLNTTTGLEVWRVGTGGYVDSSPAYSNGMFFFGSLDGYVRPYPLTQLHARNSCFSALPHGSRRGSCAVHSLSGSYAVCTATPAVCSGPRGCWGPFSPV